MRREPSPQRRGYLPPPVAFLGRLVGAVAAVAGRRPPRGSPGAAARLAVPAAGGRRRAPFAAPGPSAVGAAVPVLAAGAGGRGSARGRRWACGVLAAGCGRAPASGGARSLPRFKLAGEASMRTAGSETRRAAARNTALACSGI